MTHAHRSGRPVTSIRLVASLVFACLLFAGIEVESTEAAVVEITSSGTPTASSLFSGYQIVSGVDANSATDWYSDGCGGGFGTGGSNTESYFLEFSQDVFFTRTELDPENLDGFGFEKLQFRIFDLSDNEVYTSAEIGLTGLDVDVDHDLPSVAKGRRLEILMTNHENCACGGFSELRVFGSSTALPASGTLGLAVMALAIAALLVWVTAVRRRRAAL